MFYSPNTRITVLTALFSPTQRFPVICTPTQSFPALFTLTQRFPATRGTKRKRSETEPPVSKRTKVLQMTTYIYIYKAGNLGISIDEQKFRRKKEFAKTALLRGNAQETIAVAQL